MLFKGCCFFLFLALVAILLAEQNHFSNVDKGVLEEHFCDFFFFFCNWALGLGGDVV